MVAKTPPSKEKKMAASLNPNLVRETVMKVDRCMARLQELQYTVSGGRKVVAGVSLSPRSTRGYLRTSLRCKQESLRNKNAPVRKSPTGKFPDNINGEWRRMSLQTMLLGETVLEIQQASHFAKKVVALSTNLRANKKSFSITNDPKTPVTIRSSRRNKPLNSGETTELRAKRTREKRRVLQTIRSESGSPPTPRARSRIIFKTNSPPIRRDHDNIRHVIAANRVSPKHRPWAKKAVLFPNPIFISSPSSRQHTFCKTRSPIISRTRQTPHKFLIKSPPPASKKFQVGIKNTRIVSLSPPPSRSSVSSRPKMAAVSKLRRSFSPSKLANRLISPLKGRMSSQRRSNGSMNSLKQEPSFSTPLRIPGRRRT